MWAKLSRPRSTAFTTEPQFNLCVCLCVCACVCVKAPTQALTFQSSDNPVAKFSHFLDSGVKSTHAHTKQACCLHTPHVLFSQCKAGVTPQTQNRSGRPHPPTPSPSRLLLPSILTNAASFVWCWSFQNRKVGMRRHLVGMLSHPEVTLSGGVAAQGGLLGASVGSAVTFREVGLIKKRIRSTLRSYSKQSSSELPVLHLNVNFQAQPEGKYTFRRWCKAIRGQTGINSASHLLPFNPGNQHPQSRELRPSGPEEDRQRHWLQHKTRVVGRGKTHVLCCSPWPGQKVAFSSG